MSEFKNQIIKFKNEATQHLNEELLPFWLDRCKDDINGGYITHFDKDGRVNMVDVSGKETTHRTAIACGSVIMDKATLDLVKSGNAKKGDKANPNSD